MSRFTLTAAFMFAVAQARSSFILVYKRIKRTENENDGSKMPDELAKEVRKVQEEIQEVPVQQKQKRKKCDEEEEDEQVPVQQKQKCKKCDEEEEDEEATHSCEKCGPMCKVGLLPSL
jgi:TolA-binding protein